VARNGHRFFWLHDLLCHCQHRLDADAPPRSTASAIAYPLLSGTSADALNR